MQGLLIFGRIILVRSQKKNSIEHSFLRHHLKHVHNEDAEAVALLVYNIIR